MEIENALEPNWFLEEDCILHFHLLIPLFLFWLGITPMKRVKGIARRSPFLTVQMKDSHHLYKKTMICLMQR